MTLEEFANKKLSTRAKNVVLSLTKDSIYTPVSVRRHRMFFTVQSKPDAHIFDVFNFITFEALMRLPNCGLRTAIEIDKALKEEGFLHWRIEQVITFIKATREEAISLAYEIGGGEIHALHIQKGFAEPAEKPVGFLVQPFKEKNT